MECRDGVGQDKDNDPEANNRGEPDRPGLGGIRSDLMHCSHPSHEIDKDVFGTNMTICQTS